MCLVAQLCLALCDPLDCSPPGSSVHGILQARILEWVAISFSWGSSWPRGGRLADLGQNPDLITQQPVWKNSLFIKSTQFIWSLPGATSGKEPACQCRRSKRCGFYPWIGKIPRRRAWQPTPVFSPGESHGQRGLVAIVHGVAKSQT